MSEARYPTWPTERWATREEAIAAAIAELDDGDTVTVHQSICATKLDHDCDCDPEVIVVQEGRA